jgi:hypothetical protein
MYDFAIVALLALATLKLVDFLTDAVPQLRNLRSLATFVIGVGATVLIDYSLFRGFGIGIRNDTVGVWVTGFVVAGLTVPWRALFGWLTHDRAAAEGPRRVTRDGRRGTRAAQRSAALSFVP